LDRLLKKEDKHMLTSQTLLRILFIGALCAAGLLAQTAIVVRADEAAQVSIDTDIHRFLIAYLPVEITVLPGKHLVSVVSVAGPGRYDKVVEVNSGKEFVLADLAKVRADKKAQEIASETQEKRQQDHETAQSERAECQQRKNQLQQQYQTLMNQYQAEMSQVQQANQLAQINGNTAGQGGIAGGLAGIMRGLSSGMAQQHQQKANMLQMQMQQVQMRVSALGCSAH
jgi:hypothetical protein